jgi:UDP-N-acetyl-D-glucosamine dehydrogenase
MLCHEMGIDVWEVIDAAATKPFGFMPFFPGPGIGGHCIPLDPTYLAWEIRREAGRRFSLLEQAQDVNERMPDWVASRVGEILNDRGRAVKDAHLLVLGVTYKADVGDVRESPSIRVMQALHRKGAHVSFHDFYVKEIQLNDDVARSVEDLDAALAEADCVLLLTPHSDYDLERIAERAKVVFDTRNAYGSARRPNVVTL